MSFKKVFKGIGLADWQHVLFANFICGSNLKDKEK
jgi:hypothetical protein